MPIFNTVFLTLLSPPEQARRGGTGHVGWISHRSKRQRVRDTLLSYLHFALITCAGTSQQLCKSLPWVLGTQIRAQLTAY